MLEFCKKVLTKVSFDRFLFKKELLKAIKWLNKDELVALQAWCMGQFGNIYGDIIKDSFRPALA